MKVTYPKSATTAKIKSESAFKYNKNYSDEMNGKKTAKMTVEKTNEKKDTSRTGNTGIPPENLPFPLIGTDESGKGDYFGPLVAAGMYVDENTAVFLKKIGVKDSKLLTDKEILVIAKKIKEKCHNYYSVIEISPERYNRLYEQFRSENKNLNTLLAWAHAKAIEEVLSKKECRTVISDKFGNERYILSKLQERGRKVNLIQVTKAERNIAVAAASILARDRFLEKLEKLSKNAGFTLPKGASDSVIFAGKRILKEKGEKGLLEFAKVHFKTTKELTK
ncbi:ribonuclease HIII [Methanomicrobium antiquum]|uniref:Ribonuclease n=1 Tax=Methanomicrobium antiquum TaxID=487686 RepID=A0AAF0JML2_9EURY|nr:ribonuclease HIII [Methanomicrobium antiquum]WFN36551.1 ribonuclease HIII [Methanomicrobium antiquum]